MGRPHVRPVCFAVPAGILSKQDAVRTIRALIGTDGAKVLRLFADPGDLGGQTFRFRPRDWNEKALTAFAVRAFSLLFSPHKNFF